jgi:Stage II sporulation protein E (SpoIIE)
MTAALFLDASGPLMDMLFPPASLAVQVQRTPTLIFGVLESSLAIAFIALWRSAPDFRAFRMLGLFYSVVGFEQFLQYRGGDAIVWSLRSVAVVLLIETAAQAMSISNYRWTRLFWPLYLFSAIALWFPGMLFVRDYPLLSQIPLAILVVQGFRRGSTRDRLIAGAFFVHFLVRNTLSPAVQKALGIRNYFVIGGWQWQYTTITLTLLGGLTLAIFVGALIRDRDEKQRLAAELAAGRAVQQLLITESAPAVPGFRIESVYKPYGEVGGDFFQIVPCVDGGLLIAVGDVSGKGMSAAMMVSLLVGALHAFVETTTSPAELLRGLNRRTVGRTGGGFITCLCAYVTQGGEMTVANAGHLAPYLSGRELTVEGGLPLGIAVEATYCESEVQLEPGDSLTFLSDGVVEARNGEGELFGFERTRDISESSVEEIAGAAQAFGQEDDITVLRLDFVGEVVVQS